MPITGIEKISTGWSFTFDDTPPCYVYCNGKYIGYAEESPFVYENADTIPAPLEIYPVTLTPYEMVQTPSAFCGNSILIQWYQDGSEAYMVTAVNSEGTRVFSTLILAVTGQLYYSYEYKPLYDTDTFFVTVIGCTKEDSGWREHAEVVSLLAKFVQIPRTFPCKLTTPEPETLTLSRKI